MNLSFQTVHSGAGLLSHLAVISVTGSDAVHFIHNQLSQDFSLLQEGEARFSAYCNPKGRVIASLAGLKLLKHSAAHAALQSILPPTPLTQTMGEADALLLVCQHDMLPTLVQRLRMYVLRSQVQLHDVSAHYCVYGFLGKAALDLFTTAENAPDKPIHRWTRQDIAFTTDDTTTPSTLHAIALDSVHNTARALCLAPCASLSAYCTHRAVDALDLAIWEQAWIAAGIACIGQPLTEQFVPQMLNYESVEGINFKKGCYPGQEVVARSQFRGTLKRRTYPICLSVHPDISLGIGQEVSLSPDNQEICGTIVQITKLPNDQSSLTTDKADTYLALICLQIHALERLENNNTLYLAPIVPRELGSTTAPAAKGIQAQIQPLPYALLQDIA